MFNFVGICDNKRVQLADIKVFGNSRVRLGQSAMEFLGLDPTTHRLFIDKDRTTNRFWVAAIPEEKNEKGKVISAGKQLNAEGAFGNDQIHASLGGQFSEWKIEKLEGTEHEGITYYPLTMLVEGAVKREELNKAAGLKQDGTVEVISEVNEFQITESESEEPVLACTDDDDIIPPYNV